MAAPCGFTRTPAVPRSPAIPVFQSPLLVSSESVRHSAISHSHQPPVSTAALLTRSRSCIAIATAACCSAAYATPKIHISPMDAPTTSSSPFPGTSFVILSVSIVGILATSLLLLAYYLFLTRCGLLFFWRPGGMRDDDDDVLAGHRHVIVTVHEPTPPRRSGLEDAAIRRIPTFRYRHGARHHLVLAEANQKQAAAECAVCLADFRDGERLRVLPPCLHAFHIDCIDAWLQSAATCPLCRAAVSDPAALHYHHLDVPAVPVQRAATDDIVVDVIGTRISPSAADDDEPAAALSRETAHRNNSCSMGGGGDGCFLPIRRSLSMDSSTDKRFYLALQSILRQSSPAVTQDEEGKAESSNAAADTGPPSSRRLRRSFFSFSQSRGSRSAVLPL